MFHICNYFNWYLIPGICIKEETVHAEAFLVLGCNDCTNPLFNSGTLYLELLVAISKLIDRGKRKLAWNYNNASSSHLVALYTVYKQHRCSDHQHLAGPVGAVIMYHIWFDSTGCDNQCLTIEYSKCVNCLTNTRESDVPSIKLCLFSFASMLYHIKLYMYSISYIWTSWECMQLVTCMVWK